MYSTCVFCAKSLGRNETLEHFPVGRRIAFDADRGRLWAICPHCERWSLSPIHERWEAIEEAERQFETATRRASTDNIGLARVAEGTSLIRIGKPQRPEFAAWRYGDQFGRRRRRQLGWTAAGLVGVGALFWGGPALGLYASGSIGGLSSLVQAARSGIYASAWSRA